MPTAKLPVEVVRELPEGIDPNAITSHASASASLDGPLGDTIFLVHRGQLAIVTRASGFEPFTLVDLDTGRPPNLEEGDWESFLVIATTDGEEHRLRLSSYEKDPVMALLAGLGDAAPPGLDSPHSEVRTPPLSAEPQPSRPTPDIEPFDLVSLGFEGDELSLSEEIPARTYEHPEPPAPVALPSPPPPRPAPPRLAPTQPPLLSRQAVVKPPGGGGKAVLALSFVVLLVLAGGGVAFYLLQTTTESMDSPKNPSVQAPQTTPSEAIDKGPRMPLTAPVDTSGGVISEETGFSTSGGLDTATVSRVVRRHSGEARYCAEQESARNPRLEGSIRIQVEMVIAPSGQVSSARVTENLIGGQIGNCVTEAVRRWVFPSSQGVTRVTYPFVFLFENQ